MTEPGTFSERYRILDQIGHGGMAEVYLARATGAAGFEREVVVKRLLPERAVDPGLAASFLAEARLLALLDHPHIAHVYDVGEGPEGCFLVMEHIHGCDLRQLMQEHKRPLPAGLAALIVRDVAEAIHHGFHRCDHNGVPLKLVHRDVSLANIMISMSGVVKLIDFGLAKALTSVEQAQTASGVVKGKWTYLAPEQLRGRPADHRSDIFSVGVVLFELCAGRKLFRATGSVHEVLAERERPIPSLASLQCEAPPAIDAILGRALTLDPRERYATAGEMADALDDVVHQEKSRPAHLEALMARLFQPGRSDHTRQIARAQLLGSEPGAAGEVDAGRATTAPAALPPAPRTLAPSSHATARGESPTLIPSPPPASIRRRAPSSHEAPTLVPQPPGRPRRRGFAVVVALVVALAAIATAIHRSLME